MSITNNPTYEIKIENLEGKNLFKKNFSSAQEVVNFSEKNCRSVVSRVNHLLCPIRTDNLRNLSKDLFLPTFVNIALKIEIVVEKIFVSILAVVLDLATLPCRFIALPFRVIYNATHQKEIHPIVKLISKNGNFSDTFVKVIVTQKRIFPENATDFPEAHETICCRTHFVKVNVSPERSPTDTVVTRRVPLK